MNRTSKYFLIGSALLVTITGSAMAFNNYGDCYMRGSGMRNIGPYNQMQGNMRGMRPMKWQQGMQGQRRMAGPNSSPMRGVYRLNDLSSKQLQQLDALRQTGQEWRSTQQVSWQAHRTEMKDSVDAILTEQQRQRLNR